MIQIDNLFSAHSIIDNFVFSKSRREKRASDKNARIDWYYADQKWRKSNYDEIIEGYSFMAPAQKKIAEHFVSKYFTIDEVEFLRQCVEKDLGINLVIKERTLPIDIHSYVQKHKDNISFMFNYGGYKNSNYISLNGLGNHNLPFKVRGDLRTNLTNRTNSPFDHKFYQFMIMLIEMNNKKWAAEYPDINGLKN